MYSLTSGIGLRPNHWQHNNKIDRMDLTHMNLHTATVSSFKTIMFLLLALIASTGSHAQSLKTAQADLVKNETKLKTLNNQKSRISTALQQKTKALTALTNTPSPEKDHFRATQIAYEKSQSTYQSTPSSQNKARMMNAKFKMALAERQYKKSHLQWPQLERETKTLKEQLTQNSIATTTLNDKITQQRTLVRKLQQEQVQKTRQLQKKQQDELKRQKAQVAQMKADLLAREKQADTTKTLPEPKKPVTPKAMPLKKTAVSPPKAEPGVTIVERQPPPPKETKKVAVVAKNSTKNSAILLATPQAIEQQEQRLKTLVSQSSGAKTIYNRILYIKSASQQPAFETRSETLDSLGYNQYKGKGRLTSGDTIFAIGFYRWHQTVPEHADGQPFTFILDLTEKNKPNLYYYQSNLASQR